MGMVNLKRGKDLLFDTELQDEQQAYFEGPARRDVYYSALVRDIVRNNRASQVMKIIFFTVVCAAFLVVCIGGIVAICLVAKKPFIASGDIGVAITGLGAILSTIIVLPSIIANHLFPKDGETVRFNFIKDNQAFDQHYTDNNVASNTKLEVASADEIAAFFREATDATKNIDLQNNQPSPKESKET